jgi:hypothetical protein
VTSISPTLLIAMQALAAAAELAIPHFVSASIFAVAGAASPDRFRHNLQMLMVRVFPAQPLVPYSLNFELEVTVIQRTSRPHGCSGPA